MRMRDREDSPRALFQARTLLVVVDRSRALVANGARLVSLVATDNRERAMNKLTSTEAAELRSLEGRVELALQAVGASQPPAPEPLRELLIEALLHLKALTSGSRERSSAVESIERALAALAAWRRWQPPATPSA
jgi:hypothetical protein